MSCPQVSLVQVAAQLAQTVPSSATSTPSATISVLRSRQRFVSTTHRWGWNDLNLRKRFTEPRSFASMRLRRSRTAAQRAGTDPLFSQFPRCRIELLLRSRGLCIDGSLYRAVGPAGRDCTFDSRGVHAQRPGCVSCCDFQYLFMPVTYRSPLGRAANTFSNNRI
jgi:hypothetical protein